MSSKRSDNTNVLLSLNGLIGRLRSDSVDAVLNDYDKQSELMKDNELFNRFKSFFSANQHLLKKEERAGKADKLLFQLAYEEGEGSSISEQAEDLIKKEAVDWPWMKQLNRKKGSGENPNYKTIVSPLNTLELVGERVWPLFFVFIEGNKALSYSGSTEDRTLRLWNLKDGSSKVFIGHTSWINGVQLLDSERVLSYSEDSTLRLWNLKDGSSKEFIGHTSRINGVQLLDSERVLSYSGDGTLRLWNLKDGSSKEFKGHTDPISGVQLLDGERALSYSIDSTLRLWNLKDGSSKEFKGHTDPISGVQLLDGERALSYSDDYTLRLWNLKDGSSKVLEGNTVPILGVQLLDGERALSYSPHEYFDIRNLNFNRVINDSPLRFWNLKDGTSKVLEGHTDWILGVQLLDGERALSYSRDGTLRLWNLKDGSSKVFKGHTDWIEGVQLLDGERALSYSRDSTLRLWNFNDGTSKVFEGHTATINGVELLSGSRAISWAADGTIRFWNLENGREEEGFRFINTANESPKEIIDFLSIDEHRLISWTGNNITFWDLSAGTDSVFKLAGTSNVKQLNNNELIVVHQRTSITLLNIVNGDRTELQGHKATILDLLLINNNKALLSWSEDGTIKLWDLKTTECLMTYVFEGVEKVFKISDSKYMCISSNKKYRTLELENF